MAGEDVDVQDNLMDESAAARRDLLGGKQERLQSPVSVRKISMMWHETDVEQGVHLVDDCPLLISEDVRAETDAAGLVKLDHVAKIGEDRTHDARTGKDLRNRVPPGLDRANENVAVEIRRGGQRGELGPDRRAVPDLARQREDLFNSEG